METASLGIIGGADGPTVIFVTGNAWPVFLAAAAAAAVILLVRYLRNRK
nr:hypothetical protein [Oscillospiraceae bacterium]